MAKTILITGSSTGIGKATALYFSDRSWNVAATMRTPDKTAGWPAREGLVLQRLDVTDAESIRRTIGEAVARFGSIEAGKSIESTRERLPMLVAPALEGSAQADKASKFLWSSLSTTCLYAARRVPEIADRIVEVDDAMRWGFGWELGPFEAWDAIGIERMAKALEKAGNKIPPRSSHTRFAACACTLVR